MELIAWEGLAERVNADPEFAENARFWSARLRLDFAGEASRCLHIEDGAVKEIEECAPSSDSDVSISAGLEDWAELLAELPKPFYQDIYGAAIYHGVEIDSGSVELAAYYPAVRRLIDILREQRAGKGA